MNFFRTRKMSVSDEDQMHKVHYLGNVQTTFSRADQCTDKPVAALWSNYSKSKSSTSMKLTVCAWGMKVETKQHGVTEYRAHRISYFTAHSIYPRLFVWIYRHEGKKMKVELRCHAALCKTPDVAKALCVQLHDKLSWAFAEFLREKVRRQNSRLVLQRLSLHGVLDVPRPAATRSKFLCTGQHFKPPVEQSTTAPKLRAISEDGEGERLEQIGEEDEEEYVEDLVKLRLTDDIDIDEKNLTSASPVFDVAIGNDVEALRSSKAVQAILEQQTSADVTNTRTADCFESDGDGDESFESGFDDVDYHESTSASSASSSVTSHPASDECVVANGNQSPDVVNPAPFGVAVARSGTYVSSIL